MSELYKKVEFLKGLAEGMNLKEDKPEHKLLLKILETLDSFAEELGEMQLRQDELDEFVDNLDEDLAELEDAVFEDEDEDGGLEDADGAEEDTCIGCGHGMDQDGEAVVEYECPHCGYQTKFDITDFDFEEDYLCPQCHQPFFPEHAEDEDGQEEDSQPEG